ncbi:MAG: hypothetical protein CBARDMAM_2653 [uncultured Caballeronia sp.]|nr:MAG: hypothetical protein CBARDMAM_2653 [uncultured Caballeronia sp.]
MPRTQYWFGYQFDRRLNDTFSVSQNVRYLYITAVLPDVGHRRARGEQSHGADVC